MASGEQFDMGRVFSGTFSGIFGNIAVLGGFALAVSIIYSVNNVFGSLSVLQTINPYDPANALGVFTSAQYWVTSLIGSLISSFGQAGLLSGLLADIKGERPDFSTVLSGAVRYTMPILSLNILWWSGVIVGWLFVFIPGMILTTIWSAAIASLVAENIGVIGSFSRSRDLTRGHRWMVLFTLLIFLILLIFIVFAAQGFSTTGLRTLYQISPILTVLVTSLSGAVSTLLLTGFLAALYRELRLVKDGGTMGGLQEVFS